MYRTNRSTTPRKDTRSRKKSCLPCAKAKVRCDLERPICTRCVTAKKICSYATPPEIPSQSNRIEGYSFPQGIATPTSISLQGPLTDPSNFVIEKRAVETQPTTVPAAPGLPRSNHRDTLDFSHLDHVPLSGADEIQHRWMRPFLATGEDAPKAFQPFTLQYISCVLRTYPKQMTRIDTFAPIIHPAQMIDDSTAGPLANCYSLVRMWYFQAPGSDLLVAQTIQREMNRLETQDLDGGQLNDLATFQAYLVYAILGYLSPDQKLSFVNETTMMTLQEMAGRIARSGLVSQAELHQTLPEWESWIVVAAKRRAIFAFYLLISVYNAENDLPNFIAEELRDVYAPDAKQLWEAKTRLEWQREYRRYLSQWEDGQLKISELWLSPETGTRKRRERIDRWVQTADEFGMMLFAVCIHLHGY
ncbi:Hypothetical protein R9X50_00413300 [Acrodontium crateriforme]|uniref:Zn(2)-C6 fungal-type domain-containing protein n=1 Tax=Acrodontium crateriforme TaxID=150365 RepID=A0AAQ3M5L1_9PEZI|nr:Hypothetical protein R9X50_00413300 [Acrodontium crateriforme]